MTSSKTTTRLAAAGFVLACSVFAATAEPVELRSADGLLSLHGDLIAVEPDVYVIETKLGEMRIGRDLVSCIGEACPEGSKLTPAGMLI